MRRLALILSIGALTALGTPVAAQEQTTGEDWLATLRDIVDANRFLDSGARDPLLAPMELCGAIGCATHDLIMLAPHEAAALRALMAEPGDDAAAERRRIGQAIAYFERVVGPRNGTDRDRSANDHADEDIAGQLDCVAEATNTRTYLDRLAAAGLLQHHKVGDVAIRFTLLLQHIAVELIEKASGERWVVDSWPGSAGAEPVVEPYWDWRLEWRV